MPRPSPWPEAPAAVKRYNNVRIIFIYNIQAKFMSFSNSSFIYYFVFRNKSGHSGRFRSASGERWKNSFVVLKWFNKLHQQTFCMFNKFAFACCIKFISITSIFCFTFFHSYYCWCTIKLHILLFAFLIIKTTFIANHFTY